MKFFMSLLLCLVLLIGTLTVSVAADAPTSVEEFSSNSAILWILMAVGVLLVAAAVAIIVLVVLRKKDNQ